MDIGIDLGTTFSVVAVNGKVTLAPDYPAGIYLADCDVTIIPTPEGDETFPSAVWEDPASPGEFIIGVAALQKADDGEAPVLFSKRKIGTAEAIPLGARVMTARDAAREILKHLRACAEQALGQHVERAVVSHPAYFDRSQVEETRQAAIEAGIDMSLHEQMVMEPVTAALAYTRADTRDPLRIMTYDLGGGTFDVTCLERRGGVISVRAFDGDPLLGGYNFDRELANWVLARLRAKGREVVLREDDPEDRGRYARLLRLAEDVKKRLSHAAGDDDKVEVKAQNLLLDTAGRRISILERISRREFVEMIRPYLDTTVECCRRALKKADVTPEELNEVLLVGGSTYGPWVQQAIRDAFPACKPKLFAPDLCVGAGAAIHAAMVLPTVVRSQRHKLTLDVPAKTVLDTIVVAGQVQPAAAGLAATLRLPTGQCLGPVPLGADGRFAFDGVELTQGEPSPFVLSVRDAAGRPCIEHPFEVTHAPESTDTTTVTTVLPKPLYLETRDGLVPLAQEGVSLPAACEAVLIRNNDNPNISVRIYQEQEPVGAIRIENIPSEGGRGSRVEVRVIVTEKNEIRGTARIVNPAGRLVKEAPVRVTFDIPEIPAADPLLLEFAELQAKCLSILDDSEEEEEVRQAAVGRGLPLIQRIDHLVGQQPMERQEVHAALQELRRLVTPPRDDMSPPRRAFLAQARDCRKAIEEMAAQATTALEADKPAARKPRGTHSAAAAPVDAAVLARAKASIEKAETYTQMLDRAQCEGIEAHRKRDRRAWAAANDVVGRILAKVRERPRIELPPFLLKLFALSRVEEQRARLAGQQSKLVEESRLADWKGEIDRLARALQEVQGEILAVDDEQPKERVRGQLALLLTNRVEVLSEEIRRLGIDVRRK